MKSKEKIGNDNYTVPESGIDTLLDFISTPDITEEAEGSRERVFEAISRKISTEEGSGKVAVFGKRRKLWTRIAAAAVVFMVCGLGFTLYKLGYNSGVGELEATQIRLESPSAGTLEVTLPDGSLISLNSGSAISYPSFFDNDIRKVMLEGEGFFDIVKNERPFIVETGTGLEVEVLGTRFNIRSYDNEERAWLTLQKGRVAAKIEAGGRSERIEMIPDRQVVLDKTTGDIEIREVQAELFMYWLDGELVFDNNTLSDIAKVLEAKFNVKIEIRNEKLTNLTFYSQFGESDDLERILYLLSNKASWKYTIENDKVTIF